jgi:hypothetical protein
MNLKKLNELFLCKQKAYNYFLFLEKYGKNQVFFIESIINN